MKNMKKIILIILTGILFLSCDPVAIMEANIENLTSQSLTIEFVAYDASSNKILEILPNETQLFQEGFDVGGVFLEPSLIEYESVVIKNQADNILRVFKPNDTGKNIYNIDEYWIGSEPSKRFFKYKYELTEVDIE